jgi:hypothetical protein
VQCCGYSVSKLGIGLDLPADKNAAGAFPLAMGECCATCLRHIAGLSEGVEDALPLSFR